MGQISLNTHLPVWAQKASTQAQEAVEKAASGQPASDSLFLDRPNAEEATTDIGLRRDYLIQIRNMDENPEFDSALGQPGKVAWTGHEAYFQGNSLNGSMDIIGKDSVSRYRYQSRQVDYQFLQSDGDYEAGRLNLGAPSQSLRLSTESLDAPRVEVPKSTYFEATTSASEILKALPDSSEEAIFRQVFLDGTKSMVDVRKEIESKLTQGIESCGLSTEQKSKLQNHFQNLHSGTPRKLYQDLLHFWKETKSPELAELKETAGLWQAMEDFPKLQADGVGRSSEYYISPQHLNFRAASLGWDFDAESGLPIADTVIVGGGPGGLASAYHLSERGTRTVLFEGGHIGQGFSDAGAKSVHQLRTNGAASNLIYTANNNQLGVDVSMQRHLGENRKKCKEAREGWYEAVGEKEHGFSFGTADEVAPPANRGELFEHMAQVAHGLALNYPDTLVSENCPVTKIEKVDKGENQPHLFKVTTENGHQVLARSLVMATGFVGGDGEHARSLKLFEELEQQPNSGVTVLQSDHDLVKDNERLKEDILVLSDRLLGRPEIRSRIKELPPGSRISVIGGGESATKGALEALHLNPGLTLDLYASGALEPYQTQIPSGTLAPHVTEAALRHPEVGQKTLDRLKDFETPVTACTLRELFDMEAAGRVRIREMGQRFDASSVEVKPDGKGSLAVRLTSSDAAESLRRQRQSWVNAGLYGEKPPTDDPAGLPSADMVIVAAGYDKKSLRAGPLLQQLHDQGLIELTNGGIAFGEDGLTSSKDPRVAFNTAGAVAMASDTAIPGRAIRGYRLAQNFAQKLPAREKPEDRIPSKLPFGEAETDSTEENFNWEKERVLSFIDNGGVPKESFDARYKELEKIQDPAERASAKLRLDASRIFPGPNSSLATLMIRAEEAPESLSPSERLLWERAKQLTERLPQKAG